MELDVTGRINQTGIWEEGVNFMTELEFPLLSRAELSRAEQYLSSPPA